MIRPSIKQSLMSLPGLGSTWENAKTGARRGGLGGVPSVRMDGVQG
jgi:hypothetical protein